MCAIHAGHFLNQGVFAKLQPAHDRGKGQPGLVSVGPLLGARGHASTLLALVNPACDAMAFAGPLPLAGPPAPLLLLPWDGDATPGVTHLAPDRAPAGALIANAAARTPRGAAPPAALARAWLHPRRARPGLMPRPRGAHQGQRSSLALPPQLPCRPAAAVPGPARRGRWRSGCQLSGCRRPLCAPAAGGCARTRGAATAGGFPSR